MERKNQKRLLKPVHYTIIKAFQYWKAKYRKHISVSLYILFSHNKYVHDRFTILWIPYTTLVCVSRNEEAINLSPLLSLNITDKMTVFTCCVADFELRVAVIAHPDGRRKNVVGVPVWSGYVARDDAIQ